MMEFDSGEDVKQFAGEDYERAYIPPRAREVPARFDERFRYYEVQEKIH
ncbi:MAG: hypothetical protein V2I56_24930 [Desulfobacteraceae bacterium]|jgi:hypothetical protein|nr:hypothetical protein [Desulfobacteraceae bacterium]